MCKILIAIGVGIIFCGCSSNEPTPSVERLITTTDNRKPLVTKKYPGCRLLASGYLVCPKVRR